MAVIVENEIDNDIETLWQRVVREPVDNDVDVVLLRVDHKECKVNKPSYEINILGKTIKQWVMLAFDKCRIVELPYTEGADILQTIRPYLGHSHYTAVFYSDTPLLTRRTFLSIIDYVKTKQLNVFKFERGYVFDTEYAMQAQRIFASASSGPWSKNDFCVANSMEMVYNITNVLRNRIMDYYSSHGVQFVDKSTVFIDADVTIGDNVVIHPNNILEGFTEIQDNVVLGAGNHIINSKIGRNSKLMHCVIKNSFIKEGSNLEPFGFIDKGFEKK